MTILPDLLVSAERYAKWRDVQAMHRSEQAAQRMEQARMGFNGPRYLPLDDQVFFEQVLEDDDLMPVRYFEMGRIAARTVGRIHLDLGPGVGVGYATGFLVAPGVLLTNWHVLKTRAFAEAATVSFDAEDDVRGLPLPPKVFTLRPQELFVSDEALDFCFVGVAPLSIDGRARIESFGYMRLFPQTGKIVRDEYATIIQHPRGRQKHAALRNNKVLVYVYDGESPLEGNDFMYYGTDTMTGSSGSPVLSDQFFVVALHRRGVPKTKMVDGERVVLRKDRRPARPGDPASDIDYVANEGIRISRILGKVRSMSDPGAVAAQQLILEAAGTEADGPFSVPAAPPNRLSAPRADGIEDFLEITRRRTQVFAGAPGYDPRWLRGFPIELPAPDPALAAELAPRIDGVPGHVLPFHHFSTAVHAGRRMPVFAAVNIDGASKATIGAMPRRPAWSYDPRVADEHQMDDSLFSSQLQRGHMAARDFVYWGNGEVAAADVHSFTLSNVCPQIGGFNGTREWARLERNIITLAVGLRQRVSVFMGPVLKRNDPLYDDLRGDGSTAIVGSGIRLPRRFWYIVAWVRNNALQVRPYLLDQSDDIEAEGPLEIDLVKPALVVDSSIAEITRLTRLSFPGL